MWQDFLSSFSKAGGKANECSDYHYKDKNGEGLLNSFNIQRTLICLFIQKVQWSLFYPFCVSPLIDR